MVIVAALAVTLGVGVLSLFRRTLAIRNWIGRSNPGTSTKTILVGNLTRSYLIHTPSSLDKTKPVPLVLVFHGGESQPQLMERYTRFSDLADRERFIAVYPEGVNKHWNDGRPNAPNVNDVGFTVALIQDVERTFNIDTNRIYATGISNGGIFSQRLGCELSGTIAAIASVAASMPETLATRCKPSTPISVLMIHGTDDPLIPYHGGLLSRTILGGSVLSVPDTIRFWATHNKCSPTPQTIDMADRDPEDGTRTRAESYRQCTRGVRVELDTVEGGGHTWPGGSQYLPQRLIGRATKDFDGTELIWDFFKGQSTKQ